MTPPHVVQLPAIAALYAQLETLAESTPQVTLPARIEQATERDPAGRVTQDLQRVVLPNPRDPAGIEDTARTLVMTTAGCPADIPLERYLGGVELASTVTDWMLATADPPLGRLSGSVGAPPTAEAARDSWQALVSCAWADPT